MKRAAMSHPHRMRFWLIVSVFALCLLGLGFRIVQLQILDHNFLRKQGDARTLRVVSMPAYRGIITDRHDEPLAVTTPVDAIWVNPQQLLAETDDMSQVLHELARLLGLSYESMQQDISKNAARQFMYLKRQINPFVAAKIKALNIQGVYAKREYRRYYPTGEVSAHIVGFTNVDDQGQEGLELAYDHWLRGKAGQKRVVKNRLGQVIEDIGILEQPVEGKAISLSIDGRLQYLAYRSLLAQVKKHAAKSGSLVLLDVQTGEVLAMVNYPSFNPNSIASRQGEGLRNRALTDVFEPGSVIKAFSMASAFESGQVSLDDQVDTTPGTLMIDGQQVTDVRNFGRLDLTGIITKSSNVGISQVILSLPANTFTDMIFQMGFGRSTGSGFPGERSGEVVIPAHADRFSQATQAFGYGLSVTMLQLARAYAAIGAGGVMPPVSFIRVAPDNIPAGQRVMSEQTASTVMNMLKTVTSQYGSGRRAQVPGYQIVGKTGTTRKTGQRGGYQKNLYHGLFAGLAPFDEPRLAMVVMIDEPSNGEYYGGLVAAPVFATVMADALRLLNIKPDAVEFASGPVGSKQVEG